MTFRDLALSESVLRAIEEIGYEKPSPIQEKAIPPALAGRDVLGCAQTGTGKTAAFALPVLEELARRSTFSGKIRALVLTPTRELALQIEESFHSYGKYLPYRVGLVMGGVAQGNQIAALHRGVDVLVATPGGCSTCSRSGTSTFRAWSFSCWTKPTACSTWALSTTSKR